MRLPDWKDHAGPCMRCGDMYDTRFPALSRADNESDICSECGTDEAFIQWFDNKAYYELPQPSDWPVNKKYVLPELEIPNAEAS